MDIYLLDWANLLLRWLHVITAIAWVPFGSLNTGFGLPFSSFSGNRLRLRAIVYLLLLRTDFLDTG